MAKKEKECENCGGALIKKQSGPDIYYECQYCGQEEDERNA